MSETAAPVVRVVDLSKRLPLGSGGRTRSLREALARFASPRRRADARPPDHVWALRDVSLEVLPGEVVGIIGPNGAGKSTLLRILSRISAPTSGHAEIRGKVASLLEVGTGFHPELTGRENVYLNGAILGMRRAEIARRFDEIVAFAEVADFLDTPVKRFSSGMRMRLAFAVAAHLESDILLVDEVLAVGDLAFRNKCLGLMGEAARQGRSLLFVSHSMPAVEALCDRAILLDRGRIRASGATPDVVARYYECNREPRVASGGSLGRTADGDLEVQAIEPVGVDGEPLTVLQPGEDFVVRVSVHARRAIRRAVVELTLHDALGLRVATLTSRTSGRELTIPEGRSRIHCVVRDAPLTPAVYDADLRILVAMEPVLLRRGATALHFVDGDFYKSGGLPGECANARCLIRQDWAVERV